MTRAVIWLDQRVALLRSESDTFDIEGHRHLISIAQIMLEASIFGGQFLTRRSLANMGRATGLGLANLASVFASAGIPRFR